jgi:hypothetical protein
MGAHVTPATWISLSGPLRTTHNDFWVFLTQFGFEQAGFKETDFVEPDQMIQLGEVPNRIDLLTSISGVTIDEAFRTRVPFSPLASITARRLELYDRRDS